jgi:hypothetical protein
MLVACSLFSAGCAADPEDVPGPAPSGGRTITPSTPYPGENQTYAYARSLVPTEIPGFVLQSRAKEPLTIWEDPYHFHSYWIPANGSEFDGPVTALSVDAFVYDDRNDATAWLRGFEADADGPLEIRGVNATVRVRRGVAEVAFMTGDILVHSSAIAGAPPAGEHARRAAVLGAEALVGNLR